MIVPDQILWSPGVSLEEIEKQVILKAFVFFKKNKTQTANSLKINVRTLDTKISKYEYEEKMEEERQANATAKRAEFQARQRGNPPNNIGVIYSPSPNNHESYERHFPNTPSQPRMESFANSTGEHEMSMPERSQVQTVLQKQSSQGRKEGKRS